MIDCGHVSYADEIAILEAEKHIGIMYKQIKFSAVGSAFLTQGVVWAIWALLNNVLPNNVLLQLPVNILGGLVAVVFFLAAIKRMRSLDVPYPIFIACVAVSAGLVLRSALIS